MPTTKEDYFKARIKYSCTISSTLEAIEENKKAIRKTKKALAVYNAIKTKAESKVETETEVNTILNKMLENLSLAPIYNTSDHCSNSYSIQMSSDNDFLTKLSENLDLISTVIKIIETEVEAETNVFLTKMTILNKMLENLDLISTVIKETEIETKAKTVANAVLTKMLEKLNLANKTTYKAKLEEQMANHDKHYTLDRYYLSQV